MEKSFVLVLDKGVSFFEQVSKVTRNRFAKIVNLNLLDFSKAWYSVMNWLIYFMGSPF